MPQAIVNAAPMTIQHGTQDLSTVQVPRVPEAIPQHCPKFYIYAQKGPLTPQLVSGADLPLTYGMDTFDVRKKYANHSTVFANSVNAEGNAIMLQRLKPVDAAPPATTLLVLRVVTFANEKPYQRDVAGNLIVAPVGTLAGNMSRDGYLINAAGPAISRSYYEWISIDVAAFNADGATAQPWQYGLGFGGVGVHPSYTPVEFGTVATALATSDVWYPIFEFQASSFGEWGNNVGIRMWAPTYANNGSMPSAMMAATKAYPYFFSMVSRANATATPALQATIMGDQYVKTVFKPGVIDPATDARMYVGDVLLNSYQNLTDPRFPAVYGNYGDLRIYQAITNETVVQALMAQEASASTAVGLGVPSFNYTDGLYTTDANGAYTDAGLINIVSGTNANSQPYETYRPVISAISAVTAYASPYVSAYLPTQYSNLMSSGGSDGTMSNALHAGLVEAEMARYLDPADQVQELAVNVESIIYDTGFPLATKLKLPNFISQRKDTAVILSTHEVDGAVLLASEENSIAVALRTRLQMFPESDMFGTPVMRGMIVGRSALLRNSQYTKRLPLSLEIAIKAARYMGASNGAWKNGFAFDASPGSIVESMYDVSITWVPTTVRNHNWDIGLNWVQAYDRRAFFFPALKTVYNNDTSVLNSFFTMMAICQLNKVANAAWRNFSGSSGLSDAQLISRVNDYVKNNVQGRFDNRFVIVPDAQVTNNDIANGFSWTLPIKIYADNMKTVMTTYVQAYRKSALGAK